MASTRQQKRAQERSATKTEDASRVYIVVPEEFTDCMGDSWNSQTSEGIVQLDFLDVLLFTIRRCPVPNAEDSERSYELIKTIRAAENGYVELRRSDYDWMITQFKAHAHKLWTAPDAAHLRKVIEASLSAKKPDAKEDASHA